MTPAWRRGRPFDWARPAAAAQLHAAVARRRDDRHPSLGLPSASGCWRWSCHLRLDARPKEAW